MIRPRRQRLRSDSGFTLIELLVVILIIGILAAIALPSFLSQKGKASDASAKELARTGANAAETYATDHNGAYTGMTVGELQAYEKSIPGCPSTSSACLKTVTVAGPEEYTITAEATNGHTFSIKKEAGGVVKRECTPAGKTGSAGGGCQNSTW